MIQNLKIASKIIIYSYEKYIFHNNKTEECRFLKFLQLL